MQFCCTCTTTIKFLNREAFLLSKLKHKALLNEKGFSRLLSNSVLLEQVYRVSLQAAHVSLKLIVLRYVADRQKKRKGFSVIFCLRLCVHSYQKFQASLWLYYFQARRCGMFLAWRMTWASRIFDLFKF